MGPARRGVDADHAPVKPTGQVSVGLDGTQDPVPSTVRRPAAMTFVNGLPTAETLGHVPPRYACPHAEEDPVRQGLASAERLRLLCSRAIRVLSRLVGVDVAPPSSPLRVAMP